MEKTALVIGATGLVGSTLVKQLLDDKNYNQIVQFVRTPSGINHPKLIEHCIDFADPNSYQDLVKGDVLYSAFGTTLKAAGSKEKQYQIDVTFVENFCKIAKNQGVESLTKQTLPLNHGKNCSCNRCNRTCGFNFG